MRSTGSKVTYTQSSKPKPYEGAIFVAMKAIEVRERQLAGYLNDMIGTDLMIKAFKAGGPLADPSAPTWEVGGTMALFRGAYAVLRNPSGRREVSFDDVTEAAEAVQTASLLMRMLDRIEVDSQLRPLTADQGTTRASTQQREAS